MKKIKVCAYFRTTSERYQVNIFLSCNTLAKVKQKQKEPFATGPDMITILKKPHERSNRTNKTLLPFKTNVAA